MFFGADHYERTGWGALLVGLGVLIGTVLAKLSDFLTIWYKAKTDAAVSLIKAQAEAKAADNRDCEKLRAEMAELADRITKLERRREEQERAD